MTAPLASLCESLTDSIAAAKSGNSSGFIARRGTSIAWKSLGGCEWRDAAPVGSGQLCILRRLFKIVHVQSWLRFRCVPRLYPDSRFGAFSQLLFRASL